MGGVMLVSVLASVVLSQAHVGGVTSVSVGAQGLVATGGWDEKARTWGLDGQRVREFGGGSRQVTGVDFSADGSRLAVSYGDGRLFVFDVATGARVWGKGTGTSFSSGVKFLAGGDVVSGGYDNLVKRWRGRDGALVRTYRGLPSDAYGVAVSRDGRLVAGGGPEGFVVWDAGTGRVVRRKLVAGGFSANDLAFSRDGRTLYVQTLGGSVQWFGVRTGDLGGQTAGLDAWSMALSPDGLTLAVGSRRGSVGLVPVRTGVLDVSAPVGGETVDAVAFSRDGRFLVAGTSEGELVRYKLPGLVEVGRYR